MTTEKILMAGDAFAKFTCPTITLTLRYPAVDRALATLPGIPLEIQS